jgi:hypothetical protein
LSAALAPPAQNQHANTTANSEIFVINISRNAIGVRH